MSKRVRPAPHAVRSQTQALAERALDVARVAREMEVAWAVAK